MGADAVCGAACGADGLAGAGVGTGSAGDSVLGTCWTMCPSSALHQMNW